MFKSFTNRIFGVDNDENCPHESVPTVMNQCQFWNYDGVPHLISNVPIQKLTGSHDLLIKVTASSINILDVYMSDGYGHYFFNFVRKYIYMDFNWKDFPLVVGRDFVGEVVARGLRVDLKFDIGTEVMGIAFPPKDGSHSEYIIIDQRCVVKKPVNSRLEETAAILYAGVTAWTTLNLAGGLWYRSRKDKSVLVLGAAGGVGTVAVQLLKAWGTKVVAVCSTDAIPVVEKLKPDKILDYKSDSYFKDIENNGPYDIVYDAAGLNQNQFSKYTVFLRKFRFSKFITLKPTFLPNTDNYGIFFGGFKTVFDLFYLNIIYGSLYFLSTINFGIAVPLKSALDELSQMLENGQIHGIIDSVYNFSNISQAYEKARKGHLRGKVIVLY